MTPSKTLPALRAELDAIDDQILALIEHRLAASEAIAEAKVSDGLLKLRPRRQAEVVARLQSRAGRAPAVAIAAIWRELMAHTLQGQARTELVLCAAERCELLEARVRLHFGAAFPLAWARDREEALRRAQQGEAIAVLVDQLAAGEAAPLIVFDIVRGAEGEAVAFAIGRVAPEDALTAADGAPAEPRCDAA